MLLILMGTYKLNNLLFQERIDLFKNLLFRLIVIESTLKKTGQSFQKKSMSMRNEMLKFSEFQHITTSKALIFTTILRW